MQWACILATISCVKTTHVGPTTFELMFHTKLPISLVDVDNSVPVTLSLDDDEIIKHSGKRER